MSVNEDPRANLVRALAAYPDVRESTMLGGPAFFIGRRLVAIIHDDRIALKVNLALRESLKERGLAVPFEPIPNPGLKDWIALIVSDGDLSPFADAFANAADQAARREKPVRKKKPKAAAPKIG